ncbi:MAG: aromatic aminobenezylarsenical efflux permease ArsG family transporter [Planctomycetes bacterium]|nr:aromatic aminobenezylarsenical efflux permease ArsG family transporter [Planctomycetota bacterium]
MDASGSPWLAVGTAVWLGVLTSISPCPLATNVAAIGYVARFGRSRGSQIAAGVLYAIGRALAYTAVGALITWGLLSAPALSGFLQRHMNQLLGPFLVLVGMTLLGLLPGLPSLGSIGPKLQERLISFGLAGSGLIGFVFALAFCPVSAALFFGSLLPLAVQQESVWLLPALYGVGSAAPVFVFALAVAIGREFASRLFVRVKNADRWILPASGWLLIGVGAYLCVTRSLRLV